MLQLLPAHADTQGNSTTGMSFKALCDRTYIIPPTTTDQIGSMKEANLNLKSDVMCIGYNIRTE